MSDWRNDNNRAMVVDVREGMGQRKYGETLSRQLAAMGRGILKR